MITFSADLRFVALKNGDRVSLNMEHMVDMSIISAIAAAEALQAATVTLRAKNPGTTVHILESQVEVLR